jgi:hypothetical protein
MMRELARQKKQERVRYIGNAAEQPDHHHNRCNRWQQHRQSGQEIRAPTRKQAFAHARNVGRLNGFLNKNP